jgi:Xaa-Pro aminopeptidase
MLNKETAEQQQRFAAELTNRVRRAQDKMSREGLSALIVYGNTKVIGSYRYLSGNFLDRCGWVSQGPSRSDVTIFDGAAVVVPRTDDPVLLLEPGQMFDQPQFLADVRGGGLGGGTAGLTPRGVFDVLQELEARDRVGIETWDRFPAPLYLGLTELMPECEFVQSTVIEELRLTKSEYELELLQEAAEIGDIGHQTMTELLRRGDPVSELDAIRAADAVMRGSSPLYEDPSVSSPSKIGSGSKVGRWLLHVPMVDKMILKGDIVCWDICMRYQGYAIDISRTRMLGRASPDIRRAYQAAIQMSESLIEAAKPGVPAVRLKRLAHEVARDAGFELWEDFVGHGLGLDTHERPDMGVEETELVENMVLCIEPRISIDDRWLLGNEDMVVVTPNGGQPLTRFPKEPLEL